MSLLGKNQQQPDNRHLPAVAGHNMPAPADHHHHKPAKHNNTNYLKFIPDWVLDFLFDALRKALAEQKGNCVVMYLKSDKEIKGKKGIEDKVDIAILDYDPQAMKKGISEALAETTRQLQELQKRNKFLEPKYQEYLKMMKDGK